MYKWKLLCSQILYIIFFIMTSLLKSSSLFLVKMTFSKKDIACRKSIRIMKRQRSYRILDKIHFYTSYCFRRNKNHSRQRDNPCCCKSRRHYLFLLQLFNIIIFNNYKQNWRLEIWRIHITSTVKWVSVKCRIRMMFSAEGIVRLCFGEKYRA